MASDADMRDYYRARAPVYDRVYAYPERQDDLRHLQALLEEDLRGLDVLEVAAGTGYWTRVISGTARTVLATDCTAAVLQQLARRDGLQGVPRVLADAYALPLLGSAFSGAFAGLWLSHVPYRRWPDFFSSLHRCLAPGARVVLLDNSTAQCERLPLSHTDGDGNTYQDRVLDDGRVHRVLKNFPAEARLQRETEPWAVNPQYRAMEHFWYFSYDYRPAP